MPSPALSTLRCPHCAHEQQLAMPADACVFFHVCTGCGITLRPRPGDCCVFCSYGTVACPPIQAARSTTTDPPPT